MQQQSPPRHRAGLRQSLRRSRPADQHQRHQRYQQQRQRRGQPLRRARLPLGARLLPTMLPPEPQRESLAYWPPRWTLRPWTVPGRAA
jgi:hypothetical protein